ncbi:Kelch repeat-containing protein, partial [Streptomyces katrae]|uniref:Kelch repeat-containing protein n=1 Tax=Streptomyces katrae TaxID=68223 RepID=UPI000A6FE640
RTARSDLAATAAPCSLGQTGMCIYAVGGVGVAGSLGSTESYNPISNTWSTVASMPTPRSGLGAAAAPCSPGQQNTCVYAVGGFDSTQTNVVQSYNPAANTWTPVASLPTPRSNMGTTATTCPPGQSGTCIYIVGGLYVTHLLASVQSYNPASNIWTDLPPMPTPRWQLGAVAMPCPTGVGGNCVYASGGADGSDVLATLEALDPPEHTKH